MKLADFEVGLDRPVFLIAGTCVVESESMAIDTAGKLKEMTRALGIPFGFNMGGTTTETQPGTNRLAGALGGALTAAQIWNLLSK